MFKELDQGGLEMSTVYTFACMDKYVFEKIRGRGGGWGRIRTDTGIDVGGSHR